MNKRFVAARRVALVLEMRVPDAVRGEWHIRTT